MNKLATKQQVKTAKARSCTVVANNPRTKEIINRAFSYFHNKFNLTPAIEAYCSQNAVDLAYTGIADGQFHKTIPVRHKQYADIVNLKLINKSGKDCYGNHLVIPQLNGTEITGLKFVDLKELEEAAPVKEKLSILPINENSFRVTFCHRIYLIKNLVPSSHSLKATIKFSSGKSSHTDVINFLSAGNRKRLIRDICESYYYPFEDIRSDINSLLEVCENYLTDKAHPNLSKTANELYKIIAEHAPAEFTCLDLEELTLWNRMKVHRAVKELHENKQLNKLTKQKPYTYEIAVILLQDSVDLQGFNKIT